MVSPPNLFWDRIFPQRGRVTLHCGRYQITVIISEYRQMGKEWTSHQKTGPRSHCALAQLRLGGASS